MALFRWRRSLERNSFDMSKLAISQALQCTAEASCKTLCWIYLPVLIFRASIHFMVDSLLVAAIFKLAHVGLAGLFLTSGIVA